jgi:hypothetical protein
VENRAYNPVIKRVMLPAFLGVLI